MRRQRRFSSRARPSRKTYWSGAVYQTDNVFAQDGDWACGWVAWPAGSILDPQQSAQYPTPSDTTLIRTLSAANCWTGGSPAPVPPYSIYLGLIAYDGGNPLLWSNNSGGSQPTPAAIQPPLPFTDSGEDWIIRIPMQFSITAANRDMPGTSDFTHSKAKRKLPPGTGVLAVIEYVTLGLANSCAFRLQWDVRMAFRSGYFSQGSTT